MRDSTLNSPRPVFRKEKPTLVFKIFFDPDSGRCCHKTTGLDVDNLPYIVVDYKTYSDIDVCSNYIVKNGQIEKVKQGVTYKKLSKVDNGSFRTTKSNMIFIVNYETDKPTDTWDLTQR